jgi:hypothetical protein
MGEPISNRLPVLSFNSQRRFGIELEVNAFDKKARPEPGKRPLGIEHISRVVQENAEEGAEIKDYEHTQENQRWIIKPDSSCGIEICNPPMKGWRGIKKVCNVVEAFAQDPKIMVDKRCSVHVHVEVADLCEAEIASIIIYWIKAEQVFLDLVPTERKRNRYCQSLGITSLFDVESQLPPVEVIRRIGDVKYYTLNTNQMRRTNNQRKTIEFRIIEGQGCKDPFLCKNWIRLILHFVEMTCRRPLPPPYKANDPWSGFCLLDTKHVMELLGFGNDPPVYELSSGLTQTRNWMLARLMCYINSSDEQGPRWKAAQELHEIIKKFAEQGVIIDPKEHLSPSDLADALYNDGLRY